MKKNLVIFLFIFQIFANEIKIATFNTENLFDGNFIGSEYKDFKNWNEKDYKKKLNKIAKIINGLDADVIALQEIENNKVLKDLASLTDYNFQVFTKQKGAPIGLGLISKIPFKKSEIFKVSGVKTREILRVEFNFNGANVSFFVVHFPAGGYKNIEAKKRASAVLQNAIKSYPNSILLGDFNSNYGQNFILKDLKNYENLWRQIPANLRQSHVSGGSMDHVLINKNLYKFYKKDSFGVRKPSFFENFPSDHYPLYFSLNLEPVSYKEDILEEQKNLKLSEIYNKTQLENSVLIKNAVVTFADNFGFNIAQNDKKGVYVYDKFHTLKKGEVINILVKDIGFFKGNFQIIDYEIINKIGFTNANNFMIKDIKTAKSGDVIEKISGNLKNGYLFGDFGKIRVFSHKKRLQNSDNVTFFGVRILKYKNELEILID